MSVSSRKNAFEHAPWKHEISVKNRRLLHETPSKIPPIALVTLPALRVESAKRAVRTARGIIGPCSSRGEPKLFCALALRAAPGRPRWTNRVTGGRGHVALDRPPHRGTRGVIERLVYCRDSQVTGSRAHLAESKSQNGIPSGQLNHANSPEFRSSGAVAALLPGPFGFSKLTGSRGLPVHRSGHLGGQIVSLKLREHRVSQSRSKMWASVACP